MFKQLVGGSRPLLSGAMRPQRFFCVSNGRASEFDELKVLESTRKNATTVFDIDELIANSPGLVDGNQSRRKYDDYSFGSLAKDPREVAKAINITGPASGRSVDVKFNNVGFAIGNVYSILRTNNVRTQWNLQKRYMRPAKYQKDKHRKWWRKQFAKGFSDLMAQVTDAKRRGY
ncbi:CIC11C00000002334 [Sungouiella intermedia]|uniref:CIC11C00000002334 n=1 Tax=Sungouiella intermedia TaxID=45354 RepID=A0A1L0BN45_9ASCO|nr:CIC11C00000002334 [[Candida] intermedia]